MAKYGEPVISRETRLLLVTMVVSVAALWVLARIRFQERPAAAAPVPTMLAQLRPTSGYAELARLVADIRPTITAAVVPSPGGAPTLRLDDDVALTLAAGPSDSRLAVDRATGLAIVRAPSGAPPGLLPWAPRLIDYPRYLVAADMVGDRVLLRPVFVGGMVPGASLLWQAEIWQLPPATPLAPGTFVFTTEGALAGAAVEHDGGLALVPATVLMDAAGALMSAGMRPAGELGFDVQALTPAIARASGASAGVVVRDVSPEGPAAKELMATDIIEAIGGEPVATAHQWRARIARLQAGDTVALRVRSGGEVREVRLTAAPPSGEPDPSGEQSLGLRLRTVPRSGVEVLSVDPGSAAARAGLRPGDLLTVAASERAPTASQVTRAYRALAEGGALLAAVTRDGERLVVALEKGASAAK